MQVREVMLYFSLKYKGVWEDIYEAIKSFVPIDEEEFRLLKEKNEASYVTIVDEEYPKSLKNINRPPFVLYYYGKYEYINYMNKMAVVGSREPSQYGIKATQSVLSRVNGNVSLGLNTRLVFSSTISAFLTVNFLELAFVS